MTIWTKESIIRILNAWIKNEEGRENLKAILFDNDLIQISDFVTQSDIYKTVKKTFDEVANTVGEKIDQVKSVGDKPAKIIGATFSVWEAFVRDVLGVSGELVSIDIAKTLGIIPPETTSGLEGIEYLDLDFDLEEIEDEEEEDFFEDSEDENLIYIYILTEKLKTELSNKIKQLTDWRQRDYDKHKDYADKFLIEMWRETRLILARLKQLVDNLKQERI